MALSLGYTANGDGLHVDTCIITQELPWRKCPVFS